jgi:hypothetical protein
MTERADESLLLNGRMSCPAGEHRECTIGPIDSSRTDGSYNNDMQ